MTPEFVEFPKIARLSREIIVTEKIDGSNGVIYVGEDGDIVVGSRSQWIATRAKGGADNFGFKFTLVIQRDGNFSGFLNHMVVGDNISVL